MLEREGFSVIGEAADGTSGLALAGELQPDAVLLDVQLPDASGLDLIDAFRAIDPAPVIVLTSTRDDEEWAELAVARGARGFVPKSDLSGAALSELLALA